MDIERKERRRKEWRSWLRSAADCQRLNDRFTTYGSAHTPVCAHLTSAHRSTAPPNSGNRRSDSRLQRLSNARCGLNYCAHAGTDFLPPARLETAVGVYPQLVRREHGERLVEMLLDLGSHRNRG